APPMQPRAWASMLAVMDARASNLTARVAQWSIAHRRGVVAGWLAFVAIAVIAGSAAGMVTLRGVETGNGPSRLADLTLAAQFPRERAREQILIENPRGPLALSGSARVAIRELVNRLSHAPSV